MKNINLFKKTKAIPIWNYLTKFSRERRHSLIFLNISQFLGALNDNIFKLVMVFLLINTEGAARASSILSATGATFVGPFLLFSSMAGVLADRFSKQKLLMIMKAAEIGIMFLALFAFAFKSSWASFLLLFLLATHSAMFAPSKYAIIPEVVPPETVSKANGYITSFTYLAIILGTFLASFLTEVTNRNFVLVVGVCLTIAILGFLSTFGITKTPPQGSKQKINPLFFLEIYSTLGACRKTKHLLTTIFSAAFFLLIGAYTQLNIIPFGLQSLNLSAAAGGYLFLSTAIGIALGSFIAGRISKKQVEPGISCVAGLGMGLFFILIDLFSTQLIPVVIFLVCLGFCGGLFIVPLDSFNQINSSDETRGQVMATVNFLSFIGVLLASFALFLFSQVFGLSSAHGFAVMGIITWIVALVMIVKLSDLFLSFVSRKIVKKLYKVQTENLFLIESAKSPILVLKDATWKKALLLMNVIPNVRFVSLKKKLGHGFWIQSIHEHELREALEMGPSDKNHILCVFLEKDFPEDGCLYTPSWWRDYTPQRSQLIFVRVQRGTKTMISFFVG